MDVIYLQGILFNKESIAPHSIPVRPFNSLEELLFFIIIITETKCLVKFAIFLRIEHIFDCSLNYTFCNAKHHLRIALAFMPMTYVIPK